MKFPNIFENSKERDKKSFDSYNEYFDFTSEDLNKSILDVGAGNGCFVNYLRDNLGNQNVFGLEKESSKVNPSSKSIIIGNGLNIPFEDGKFELVVSKNYLPMFFGDIDKFRQTVNEMIRVTKQGGRIMSDIKTEDGEIKTQIDCGEELYPKEKLASMLISINKCKDYIDSLRNTMHCVEIRGVSKGRFVIILTK